MKYFYKHKYRIYATALFTICCMMYLLNISNYVFVDNHETRFVSIAKEMLNSTDWINIKLNGVKILDIQPLFFQTVNFFCFIFGKINNEIMRLPVSLAAIAGVLSVFALFRKTLTDMYAFMIALVTATSVGMLVFSHIAANDMMSALFIALSVFFAAKILLVKDFDGIFQRLCVYLFAALATLSCGIFGTIIPFFAILVMNIFAGDLKKLFAFKNFIPGFILYILLVAPYNLVMINKHGMLFVKENLKMCNFINSTGINEILFVLAAFVIGFLPWSFSFLWSLGSKYKGILQSFVSYFKDNSEAGLKEKWKKLNKINKFVSLNTIFFFTAFVFSLFYGAKNYCLILLLIFPASCIAGHYWYQYIVRREHNASIFFATTVPNLILIICSLTGLFGHNVINKYVVQGLNNLIVPLIIIFFVIPVVAIFAVILKGRKIPFIANIVLMFSLSLVAVPDVFNLISLKTGENDLISFASSANKDNAPLAAFIQNKKYSLVYYYDKYVDFLSYGDVETLREYTDNNPDSHMIVEIKDMGSIEDAGIKYILLDSGVRYCVIKKMPVETEILQKLNEEDKEPEVIIF